MDTVRAFVGCLLDLAATRRVVEIQRRVRAGAEGAGWRASWVPPPNLHVTVKFLGEIDLGLVGPLSDALAQIARDRPPIRLQVAGVGAFPDRAAPRVLFVDAGGGHGPLAALASAVDEALLALGIPKERRPFHGHVTIARVKTVPEGSRRLADFTPPGAAADAGGATIAELTLYRSDLVKQGAEYHVLSRHALAGARPDRGSVAPPRSG